MKKNVLSRKERFEFALPIFEEMMPEPVSELNFSSPFQLLIAVILSAQCTDKRVNMVTPELFLRYPDAKAMAKASLEDIYELIKSISYPNNKAAHLLGAAKKIEKDFGGEVPSEIEDLMTLPGVGRKTANVVASIIYNKAVIAVDTHVFRVAHRLGLSNGKTPEKVEKDLEKYIPEKIRPKAHHWLILFGRYHCKALKPACENCNFKKICKYFLDI